MILMIKVTTVFREICCREVFEAGKFQITARSENETGVTLQRVDLY